MRSFLVFSFCYVWFQGLGQTSNYTLDNLTAKESIQFADRFFSESSYYKSAELYRAALQKDTSDGFPYRRYALMNWGVSAYFLSDYQEAVRVFREFFEQAPSSRFSEKDVLLEKSLYFTSARYYYGQCFMRMGQYINAISEFEQFIASANSDLRIKDLVNHAKVLVEGCRQYNLQQTKMPVKVRPLSAVISGPYTEFSPVEWLSKDTLFLVYSGLSIKDPLQYSAYKNKAIFGLQTSANNGVDWLSPQRIQDQEVNDPLVSSCHIAFNRDYSRVYFTRCLEMDDDRPLCNIFVANVTDGRFVDVKRLPKPINSDENFSSAQPTVRTLSSDSEVIYFSSTRAGGKGGNDIWMTIRDSFQRFSSPVLVKGGINTPFEDKAPFWDDSTQSLYFSSDGLAGMGGFDVYAAQSLSTDSFAAAVHLGTPINSSADETYIYYNRYHTYGYFTSNRKGVQTFSSLYSAADDIFRFDNLRFAVSGNLIAKRNNKPVELTGATFRLYRKMPNGERFFLSVDSSGQHPMGRFFFSLDPSTDYEIEAIKDGFETASASVSTQGLFEEDTLQQNIETRKVDFTLAGIVVEKGINPQKKLSNFIVKLEDVSQRQSPVSLSSYISADSQFAFSVRTGKIYRVSASKDGYITAGEFVDLQSAYPDRDTLFVVIPLDILQYERPYSLGNILYDFNQSSLLPESKRILDTLAQTLKDNPTFRIELASHTDALGSEIYNQKLSKARAQSCVNYLIAKGISRKRVTAVGYGESKPILPNTTPDGKDDPAARAQNRRTEFSIKKP
jgi:outer membrane protein OmpA-like peptidoglycan-associated protein